MYSGEDGVGGAADDDHQLAVMLVFDGFFRLFVLLVGRGAVDEVAADVVNIDEGTGRSALSTG